MSALKTLWLTAEQLLERWEIDALGLYQILYSELHEDLPLYNLNFQKITEWFLDAEPGKDAVLDFHQFVFHPNDPIFSDINIHPLKRLLFKREDVETFEKKHTEMFSDNQSVSNSKYIAPINKELLPKEARELGRLKLEKSKWHDSINASVLIGLFCKEQEEKQIKITRDMLTGKLFELGFGELPDTTIEKIWKAIPEKCRKKAGRPTKNKT